MNKKKSHKNRTDKRTREEVAATSEHPYWVTIRDLEARKRVRVAREKAERQNRA